MNPMELRPIPAHDQPGWYEIELSEAFPPHERKPFAELQALQAQGRCTLLGLYEGTALAGYASLLHSPDHPGVAVLDYLGVSAQRRGQGLGSLLLGLLRQRLGDETVLLTEAEAPVPAASEAENRLRLRRIGFYRRNGFVPVYPSAACGIPLQTLAAGPVGDMEALMAAHRAIYGPGRPDVRVPLLPGEIPEPPYWMKGS